LATYREDHGNDEALAKIFGYLFTNWLRVWALGSIFGLVAVEGEKINFEKLTQLSDLGLHSGRALLALAGSLVVSSWTAFESLATDLWIVAVNKRPKLLGLKIAKLPRSAVTDEDRTGRHDPAKGIRISAIEKYNLNLHDHMGDILGERFNFGILDSIRRAYLQAFGDSGAIATIVSNPDLDSLHAVRNLLVHRGGIVDEFFLSRVDKDPKLKSLQTDTVLAVDGPLALRLMRCADSCSADLFKSVSKWLTDNPDP
jgi:hypothetical protein